MSDTPIINGKCPACGRRTLFLGAGRHVTCGWLECPRPTAVDELINDLGPEHTVQLAATEFAIEHPVLERLEHRIMSCGLHAWLAATGAPPHPLGWYQVLWTGDASSSVWKPIADPAGGVS